MTDPLVCTAANSLLGAINLATALTPVDLKAVEVQLVTSVGLAMVLCLSGAILLLAPVIPGLGPKWLSKVLWLAGAVAGCVLGKFAIQSPPISLFIPPGALGCAATIGGIFVAALIVGGVAYRSLGFAFFAAGAAAGGWLGWFGLTSFGLAAVEVDEGCFSCTTPSLPSTDAGLAAYGAVAVCGLVGGLVLSSYQDTLLAIAASLTGAVLVAQGLTLFAASSLDAELYDSLGVGTYRDAYFVVVVALLMLLRQCLVEKKQRSERAKVMVQV